MGEKKDYYFLNGLTFILVFLCCCNIYLDSYWLIFISGLSFFLFDILHTKKIGSFWHETGILKYVLFYFATLFFGSAINHFKEDFISVAIYSLWLCPLIIFGYLRNKCNINKGIVYGLEAVVIIGFLYSLHDWFFLGIYRPRGLMYNCILWASCLSFLLPLFIYGFQKAEQGWRKWIRLSVCVLIVVGILLTRCRGVILALVVVGAALLFGYGVKRYRKYTLLAVSVFSIFMCIFLVNHQELFLRNYDGDRLAAWYASILMFLDHPLLGVGFSQWKYNFATGYAQPNVMEILPHAHNMYLGVLSTTGLVGFLGLLVFLGGWINISWQGLQKGNKYYAYTLVGIAIFLVHGLFDYVIMAGLYERVFWLMVFIYQWDFFEEE